MAGFAEYIALAEVNLLGTVEEAMVQLRGATARMYRVQEMVRVYFTEETNEAFSKAATANVEAGDQGRGYGEMAKCHAAAVMAMAKELGIRS